MREREGNGFGEFSFLEGLKRKFCFLYIKANYINIKNIIRCFFSPRGRKVPGLREKVGGNMKCAKSGILNFLNKINRQVLSS